MNDWIEVGAVVWMFLVAAVIFVAICRISAAMQDEKLTRGGISLSSPVHLHLRHVIQSEDRTGIVLTVAAFICSLILAFMLADWIFQGAIHEVVRVFAFQ